MSKMSDLDIDRQELEALGAVTQEDPVVAKVIERLAQRSKEGMTKYGVTLEAADHTTVEWIDHAIEEALDFANYLERLKMDMLKLEEASRIMTEGIKDVQA